MVGAYALYFIFVGIKGNAEELAAFVEANGRNFLPWILAILVLRALYTVKTLQPMVKPFIALAVLVFVLRNWNNVTAQLNEILPQTVQLPQAKP
ncbi:MAG: hypothetical protein ACP5QA_10450 [Phycisphaerae bacterium]